MVMLRPHHTCRHFIVQQVQVFGILAYDSALSQRWGDHLAVATALARRDAPCGQQRRSSPGWPLDDHGAR